jgi:hypothetical protein
MNTTITSLARAAALATVWYAAILAAPQQQPARDAPAAPAPISGTASVVGIVVFDDAPPRPARRAAVTVTNAENNRAVRTYTDDEGRFMLSRLPAGRYLLTALKAGHVTFTYGSPRLGLPASAIVLAEGQTFSAGTLKMLRGAVITGMVRGALGRPMPGVSVLATPFQVVAGERRAMGSIQTSFATTDDRGIYRMFGLAPGSYLVSVQSRFGNSTDMAQPTEAEYRAAAAPTGSGPMPASGPNVIFAPTIFPGVADESVAVPVVLSAGEERTGVDMQLQLIATAKVSGTILGVGGQPMISAIRMFARGGTILGESLGALGAVSQGTLDGAFSISGVAPGAYQLLALAAPLLANGQPPPVASLWAMTDIQVTGKDVIGLTLALQPMLKVSGTVVYEGAVVKPPENLRASIRVLSSTPLLFPGGQGPVAPDGTFTIEGIVPGSYRLVMTGSGSGTAKSALLGGKDALDVPIEIRAGADVSGLVVTVANKLGEIAGKLVDGKGDPAPRFYVQVFPTDESMWLPGARRVKNTRASTDGSFSIIGLPAGEYYVCALTEYDPSTASDPSFLAPLVASSVKVTLADGEKKVQILKLAGG